MRIKIGLELENENRATAWALDYPGCFSYGKDGSEAVIALAPALAAYEEWIHRHGGEISLGNFDLRLVDTWQVYCIDEQYDEAKEGYEVNAWFLHDWKPLTEAEVQRGLDLLRWSREDLRAVAQQIPVEVLDQTYPQERWSIRGVLGHIAGAEWWYLNRLGLGGERNDLPKGVWNLLDFVRAHLTTALPGWVGVNQVLGKDGEFWSPRKVLRRAIWHEIDHRNHILKLMTLQSK